MPSCKLFNRYGVCTRPKCKYKHKVKWCVEYQGGRCQDGKHCKYRHENVEGSSDVGRRHQQLSVSTQPVAGFASHPVSASHHPVSVSASAPAGVASQSSKQKLCVCCWTKEAALAFVHIDLEDATHSQAVSHLAACEACAGNIHWGTRKCPICNKPYDMLSMVFDHRKSESPEA